MAKANKASSGRISASRQSGGKIPITLRLDAEHFRRLERLAIAENRTPTNFVETAVLRDLEAREEAAQVITMFVPQEADQSPGKLVKTQGETDERYLERAALMDILFAIPDAE